MPFVAQSIPWKSDRAILLVHGIGNAHEGDYGQLKANVLAALGAQADTTAVYQLFYDQVNDWFDAKNNLAGLLNSAIEALSSQVDDSEIGGAVAEMVGDVLWPVLLADARSAVREAYLLQLKQMVEDGNNAGVRKRDQKLSIICHSLGCFHTYETLHHAALYPTHSLQPATHEVRFENVIFMASPVKLIRTVADKLGSLVPNKRWLYSVQGDALSIPRQTTLIGDEVLSVKRWVSITGNLDPVGGYFFRNKADWAYMTVPGEEPSIVVPQDALNINTKAELARVLRASLRAQEPPDIQANNPHSWENYVTGNAAKLTEWLTT